MLGTDQKQWFKDTLTDARDAGEFVVWASSSVWPTDKLTGGNSDHDVWGAFSYERRELADFMFSNGCTNLAIISGDMHRNAYMASADFSTSAGLDIPLFQSPPLIRADALRSARWTQIGPPRDNNHGLLTVRQPDDGGWQVHRQARHVAPDGIDVTEFAYAGDYPAPPARSPPPRHPRRRPAVADPGGALAALLEGHVGSRLASWTEW